MGRTSTFSSDPKRNAEWLLITWGQGTLHRWIRAALAATRCPQEPEGGQAASVCSTWWGWREPPRSCSHGQRLGCVLSRSVVCDSSRSHGLKGRQAPLSMGFSKQEYWSGLPCPPPGDLSDPGVEPICLMSPALASELFTGTWEAPRMVYKMTIECSRNRKYRAWSLSESDKKLPWILAAS